MIHINNRAHAAELMAAGLISSFFEIVGDDDDPYSAGYDGNAYATHGAADAAIVDLCDLGEEWGGSADVAWSVREVTA